MSRLSPFNSFFAKLTDAWRDWTFRRKAFTFALIGVLNTLVDYSVFLIARLVLTQWPAAVAAIASLSDRCRCGDVMTLTLVVSNLISWSVAVTFSYVMNSSITFAVESGRKLRWGPYLAFVVSGIVGWLANTATLLIAAEIFLLPVWLAKAVAVLASFAVNFSLSHFVVFRVRGGAGEKEI
jgi:putative flippase GtrA